MVYCDAIDYCIKYQDVNLNYMKNLFVWLEALQGELDKPLCEIQIRVLRATHDMGAMAVRAYEDTPLEKSISGITYLFYDAIPFYKDLEPLRMDYGKGDPI